MGEDFEKRLKLFLQLNFLKRLIIRFGNSKGGEHAASQSEIANTAATGELASTAADGLSDDADPRELEVDCWQHCDRQRVRKARHSRWHADDDQRCAARGQAWDARGARAAPGCSRRRHRCCCGWLLRVWPPARVALRVHVPLTHAVALSR